MPLCVGRTLNHPVAIRKCIKARIQENRIRRTENRQRPGFIESLNHQPQPISIDPPAGAPHANRTLHPSGACYRQNALFSLDSRALVAEVGHNDGMIGNCPNRLVEHVAH